jgi:D-alanyl-D-alanine carboxypeptidase (penicillin-binding protein 5/6)
LFASAAMISFTYLRYQAIPLEINAVVTQPTFETPPEQPLTWPTYGQSAVASKEYGVLATNGDTAPQPTASTAKLITLLSVMTKKPFTDGKGETITFTSEDVMRYNNYVAGNGTVTPVAAGVQWTQYQAMQAIQIDSANNVSDSLAIWTFGSLEEYRHYTQDMVKRLGMNNTTIGTDASGYSPTTTSTAHDMAILMTHILNNPTLRDIIGQSAARQGYPAQLPQIW